MVEIGLARQQEVGDREHAAIVAATSGSASSSLRMFGSNEILAPAALASSTPRRTAAAILGAEQRRAHDVEVAAAREQPGLELRRVRARPRPSWRC